MFEENKVWHEYVEGDEYFIEDFLEVDQYTPKTWWNP